jgi:hypothetical protein
MNKRRMCAAVFVAILLAGCDTTGAAPTPQAGSTAQPTGAVATQPAAQPGSGTAYPVIPTSDPNAVRAYPTPDPNQSPAVNPAYPAPDSGSGARPTATAQP